MVRQELPLAADRRSLVISGLLTGIVAGIIFAMFEMIVAALMGMGFFAPLRMISAIVLGEQALEPSYSLGAATIVGLIVHMILSAIYGLIYGLAVGAWSLLHQRVWLVLVATLYGLLLWLVNFYVIAPIAFPWFGMADPVVQFIAHAFFFGTALGLLLTWRLARS